MKKQTKKSLIEKIIKPLLMWERKFGKIHFDYIGETESSFQAVQTIKNSLKQYRKRRDYERN